MTCATCPITVKKAMEGVAGVTGGHGRFRSQDRARNL
jgi:hypothetical protein